MSTSLSRYTTESDRATEQAPNLVGVETEQASTITVTRNEMLYALNQADKFLLAIVLVGEDDSVEGPHYLTNPFKEEPGWGVSSVNYDLNALLNLAHES